MSEKGLQDNRRKTAGEITAEKMMKMFKDTPTIEDITVQKFKLATRHYMTKDMGDMMRSSMSLDKYYDEIYGNMIMQLSAYIAGNEVHKDEWEESEMFSVLTDGSRCSNVRSLGYRMYSVK